MATQQQLPPLSRISVDDDTMASQPTSIRSSDSHAYVPSYIPTSSPFTPSGLQDMISSMRSYASVVTEYVATPNEIPTVEEVLSMLERAAIAMRARRYRDALRLSLESGYALASVAERETNLKISNLLANKSFETLKWTRKLCDWIEAHASISNSIPQTDVRKIAIDVNTWNEAWTGPDMSDDEATRMWYTPVCLSNPQEFTMAGYRLRCVDMQRRPRLMICITIYNETPDQLQATLRKVANNLTYLRDINPEDDDHSLSKTYCGDDVWKNVLICIVADGRENINDKMLEYMESIGLYDQDLLTINSAGMGAACHMFEGTMRLTINGKHLIPMQAVFALKERNASKLDSHNWFFSAFADQILPDYTILMDVGTTLAKTSLYHMLNAFEGNPQIGGACGQLAVDEPFSNLSNWVISAQNFEYKISHILDKSLESCFGFITVLHGAFSGYRYAAIRGEPLTVYFQTLNVDLDVLGPFVGNMYLAEDRILCFEMLARKNCCWTMHYVKDAVARTDVPTDLVSLISQRRRWLNGEFFTTLFSLWHFSRVYSQSAHSFWRKIFLSIFYVYQIVRTVISFFMPANVYLALFFVVFQGFQQNRLAFIDTSHYSKSVRDLAVYGFNVVYVFGVATLIIISLGNHPRHMKLAYYSVTSVFGAMMMLSSLVGMGALFSTSITTESLAVGLLTLGVYVIGPALHGELHHILLTSGHYNALIPSFVNVFAVYSFCNLHDLSWGTKGLHEDRALTAGDHGDGDDYKDIFAMRKAMEKRHRDLAQRQDNKKRHFEAFRTNVLLTWAFSNLIFALTMVYFANADQYLPLIFVLAVAINSMRFIGCVGHLLYTRTRGFRGLRVNAAKSESIKDTPRTPEDAYRRLEDQNV